MKVVTFTAKDKSDKGHKWAFWREAGTWMLRDYTGYVRALEKTWFDSVPKIKLIVENHGMSCNVS
jgi:hypothetical protein